MFRKYARFIILFILFGMLIVSFAFWGVGDMLRMGGRTAEVAHIGGTKIPLYGWVGGASVSVNEVKDQFNRQLEGIQRQTGQRPEPEQALRFGLHVRALEEVIQRAVLDYTIQQFGLVVSDAEVRAAIARNPAFAGTGGSFDPLLFRNRLQNARISEQQYIIDMRREIAASQLFGAVRPDGLAPKSLRDDIFKMEAERRVAETIYIPDSIIVDVAKPTAEQLSAYFEANKTSSRSPSIAPSPTCCCGRRCHAEVGVTADMVKQEYDAARPSSARPKSATRPGDGRQRGQGQGDHRRRHRRQDARGAAKEVLGNSDGVIKLGPVTKKDLPPGRWPTACSACRSASARRRSSRRSAGTSCASTASPRQGRAVRRGEGEAREGAARPARARPSDQAGHRLRAHAGQDAVDEGCGRGLALKIKTYDNVDARGQDAEGKQVVIGPAANELVQAAFATRESAESELLETQRGEYFIVRTDRITPARVPALTEVEAKVAEAWQAEERRKLADAKVKAALDKANAGTGFDALAKELGLETRTAKPVTRFEADQGNYLTQPVVQELFKLQPGKTQSVRTAEGSVLVRLKQIEPVDIAKDKEAIDRFGKQLNFDGGQRPDPAVDRGHAHQVRRGVDEATFVAAFKPQNQP